MNNEISPVESDVFFYSTGDGAVRVEVVYKGETFWLNQRRLADLFGVEVSTINYHLKEIYKSGELGEAATIRKIRIVQNEGGREVAREVDFYNLDAVISVGYRVNSHQATQFRIWATQTLREFIIKGFVLDDERLKEGQQFGKDYFDELLERIREIRASEKRFYQKVRDLYTTAVDYDSRSEAAHLFFKKVQNKMLWAVTGQTAAELISGRADPAQPNMGLQSWAGGRVRKKDVAVAKNYLQKNEIEELDRIVVMYLDYAEDQTRRRKTVTMREWEDKLDTFLSFNERELLTHAGKVRAEVAERLAKDRYMAFDEERKAFERQQADADDLKVVEALEQHVIDKKKGKKKP